MKYKCSFDTGKAATKSIQIYDCEIENSLRLSGDNSSTRSVALLPIYSAAQRESDPIWRPLPKSICSQATPWADHRWRHRTNLIHWRSIIQQFNSIRNICCPLCLLDCFRWKLHWIQMVTQVAPLYGLHTEVESFTFQKDGALTSTFQFTSH